ncbi:MAG: endolytic transglycosylase MltG [Candidatus Latescibacteria bacterium]|nr:endolytic transglycosylase MltG [Candidatus Latescibacterota bacterium]
MIHKRIHNRDKSILDAARQRLRWASLRERLPGWLQGVSVFVWVALGGCAAILGGSGVTAHLLNRPAVSRSLVREVVIERGMSTRQIGALLEREGLIRSASFFALATYFSPAAHRLQAGLHDVDGGMTTTAIILSLETARDLSRSVTIPEGLTLKEIAVILQRETGIDAAKFVGLAMDGAFCRELGIAEGSLEGYLFPETYRLPVHVDERQVARMMVGQFQKVFDGTMRARAGMLRMSVHQVMTLASIVEREAKVDTERPLISGVFHRRLKAGMRLESDPTTEYALGIRKAHLYHSDIAVDSPYNTYRYPGLPPGPIANPGRASLRAVLYPADMGYFYFVARGDGTHILSRTKQEHDRARAQIKKEQKKQLTARDARRREG